MTDGAGRTLPRPISLLLASTWDLTGASRVFTRDDATGTWVAVTLAQDRPAPGFLPQIRSLGSHRDRLTGVDQIFAGETPRGIFCWPLPPPGRISWAVAPELDGRRSRPHFLDLLAGCGSAASPRPMTASMPRSGNRSMSASTGRRRDGGWSIPIRDPGIPRLGFED